MMASSRLAEAWLEAAQRLGVVVSAPYAAVLPSGRVVEAVALVRDFGAQIGMLIVTNYSDLSGARIELAQAGYGFSVLQEPEPGEPVTLEDYADLLRDWGWSGTKEDQPSWLEPP